MTVKELIEKLQKCHPDAEVYLNGDGFDAAGDVSETWDDSEGYAARFARNQVWWVVYIDGEEKLSEYSRISPETNPNL